MIRPLRRAHRAGMLLLALALPPAYVLALAARPAPETRAAAEPKAEPSVTVVREASGALVLEVDSRGAPLVPDALVYWADAALAGSALPAHTVLLGSLPPGALLLGALPQEAVRRFALPEAAQRRAGVAFVFSLPWQKRVATYPLAQAVLARAATRRSTP